MFCPDFCPYKLENSGRPSRMWYTSSWFTPFTLPSGYCWDLRLIIGLEEKGGDGGGGHEEIEHCLAWQLPHRRPLYSFLWQCTVTFPDRGRKAASTGIEKTPSISCWEASPTGKEDSFELRGLMSLVSSVFSYTSCFNFHVLILSHLFLKIEFIVVTLVHRTIQVSRVQLNKASSSHCITCPPPQAKSLSVPISFPLPTSTQIPLPFPSCYHHTVVCV